MTTTAMTWFYQKPENIPYYLNERINTTFWDARLGGVFLNTVRSEPPYQMEGSYNGARVRMEWEPAKWLRLSSAPAAPSLSRGLANILRRKPAIQFENPDGETVWEWWLEGADKRWQEIQGRPAFRSPKRLDQQE